MRTIRHSALCFALTLFPLLNGSDDDPELEDPAEHACEHVDIDGERVTAGETRDDTAAEIHVGEPYTVTLPDGAVGWIRLVVTDPGGRLAFTRDANVLTGLFHGDEEETLTSAGANMHCADDLAEHFDLHLHEAGTFYLRLGPTASNEAWLLLTEAEGHTHDHD